MFKSLIAILLIAIVACNDSVTFAKFQDFMKKYNKTYKTPEEMEKRFNIFKRSLDVLSTHNFSATSIHTITQFSDWTQEEFQAYLTLKVPNQKWCQNMNLKFLEDVKVAESLDWRSQGKVSPVKNQYQCGSCWAFSTTGFIESQILMKNQEAQTFSEQQLVDCDRDFDQGCNGGLQQFALHYVQDNGIMADKYYSYHGTEDTCRYNKQLATTKVNNVKCHENIGADEIKKYLNQVGPMAIALDASDMMYYSQGVLQCRTTALNHAVLLVGYGSENGQDFWIVKNSWGSRWAEDGYVRISQTEGRNCGIGMYVVSADLA